MKDPFVQINNRYKNQYYKLFDFPEIGRKVVYLPGRNSFSYAFHEEAYEQFHFEPGDVMTIKSVVKGDRFNSVFVQENACTFSPAELVPVENVSPEDIKKLKDFVKNEWSYHHIIRKINKKFRGEL